MGYGQQSTKDMSPNDEVFNNYMKKMASNQQQSAPQVPVQMEAIQAGADQAGPQTDGLSSYDKGAAGFARGAQGGLGTGVLSAGIASANPYVGAAGLGLMALEGDAQAKQANEEAQAIEAQQRKQAQMTAINNLISVSKGLSLGA